MLHTVSRASHRAMADAKALRHRTDGVRLSYICFMITIPSLSACFMPSVGARSLLANSDLSLCSSIFHRTLGSPSGRAGAKRLRGLTAPIPPTNYPQNHCTDSLYETAFLHELSAHPSPPPFGRYLSRRERQGL